ncbi:MAG: hypothetical protein ACREWG_05205 [Gammaproteobacteria bacterium]
MSRTITRKTAAAGRRLGRACRVRLRLAILVFLGGVAPYAAAQTCETVAGRMVSAEGQVEVARGAGLPWRRVGLEDTLCPGDRVRVGRHSRAAVFLVAAETLLRLDQGTTLTLLTPEAAGSSLLDLARCIS